jgi:hypothetical protein
MRYSVQNNTKFRFDVIFGVRENLKNFRKNVNSTYTENFPNFRVFKYA